MAIPEYAWLDGSVVPWARCVLHARAAGAFWGANVFEGVRAYRSADGAQLHLFRIDDHLARLRRSAKCVRMTLPYGDAEILQACRDLMLANSFRTDTHLVITGYFGLGPDADPLNLCDDVGMHITATAHNQQSAVRTGIDVRVSSWRRIGDDTMPPRIKAGGNYHNSRLAHQEAVRDGYHTALLLNANGHVAEGPGACVVMVNNGRLVTPPGTSGVLEGITVDTMAELARNELGLLLDRRELDRTELYVADEAFLCGTRQEITPILSVDRVPVGDGTAGPITRKLQDLYEQVVRGHTAYRQWITLVNLRASTR